MKVKGWQLLQLVLLFFSGTLFGQELEKVKTWKEKGGVIIIQAEHIESRNDLPANWKKNVEIPGYTGTGYLEWTGPERSGDYIPYDSIYEDTKLSFHFLIKKEGVYYIKLNAYHEGIRIDNAALLSFKKNEWKSFTNSRSNEFSWDENDQQNSQAMLLANGYYEIEITGKFNGYKLDKIAIFHESLIGSTWSEYERTKWFNARESKTEYVVREFF